MSKPTAPQILAASLAWLAEQFSESIHAHSHLREIDDELVLDLMFELEDRFKVRISSEWEPSPDLTVNQFAHDLVEHCAVNPFNA